ncbi:MAG: hypothetical protein RIA63_10860 [Cyclobacteriaceae bacterium]
MNNVCLANSKKISSKTCYGNLGHDPKESESESEKVVLENDQLEVVEFISQPNGNVCGAGMHYHQPHLVITLSDVTAIQTMKGGKPNEVKVKAGTTIWAKEETHSVINEGDEPIKLLLLYLKGNNE